MTKKDTSKNMEEEKVNPIEELESDNAEQKSAEFTEENLESTEGPVAEVKSELEILTEKYNELNDKYLRLYSDFENHRKRTSKEKLELYKTAGEDVIISLIPVIDDFERAMKSMLEAQEVKSIQEGVRLIHQKFEKTLAQKGLKEIESAIGKDFDINFHEAVTRIPATEKKLKGKVIDEIEKGYMLSDKVIRYTKVVIGE